MSRITVEALCGIILCVSLGGTLAISLLAEDGDRSVIEALTGPQEAE